MKQWDYRYGGSGGEFLYTMQQTADGGFILGGSSQSFISGDKSENPVGFYDYWILKTDADGIKEWDATFGGSDFDYLLSLQQTADGGYILGGYTLSGQGGDVSTPSQGGDDYWIVKTNASGVKEWDARFGGDDHDDLRSIIQTHDGGYLIAGYSYSGASGDKSQASQGSSDFWIVKADEDGVKEWDVRFGGTDYDQLNSVRTTDDGGYVLFGSSGSGAGGDKSQSSQGMYDYWVVKIDSVGTKEWDKRFGGTAYDYLYDAIPSPDGGYVLGGYSESGANGDKSQPSQGSEDLWIVKINSSGIKEWDRRYGGANNDYFLSVDLTDDGGFLFGGYSTSYISGDKTQDNCGVLYTYDYWVIKTDDAGNKIWDLNYGGNNWEQLSASVQTTDGGYALAGWSNSPISCEKSQNPWGFDDYWVVKLSCDSAKKFFADTDHDTYGDAGNFIFDCGFPKGYVSDSTDCDDTNPLIHPNALELNNGIDDDCDGIVDNVPTGIEANESQDVFKVYPNPAADHFMIEINTVKNTEGYVVELRNLLGEIVLNQALEFQNVKLAERIAVPSCSRGLYLLIISDGSSAKTTLIEINQ